MTSRFAVSTSRFSTTKLAGYLLGLVAITGLSLAPFGPRATEPAAVEPGAGPQAAAAELLRFGRPADEVFDALPGIGIPWFLRRSGVTGRFREGGPGQRVITLSWNSKTVGRYVERVQAIDPDRTRLYLSFEPEDMELLRRLAAPIDTSLDPPGLLRVTLGEHVRAAIDGDGFRLNVLKPDSPRAKLDLIFSAMKAEPVRNADNFPLDDAERDAAGIRQAYREEAERAGAAAAGL